MVEIVKFLEYNVLNKK